MTVLTFDQLPPRARDRAIRLQGTADTARAATSELSAQLRDLRWNRQEVSNHLRVATDRRFSGGRDILAEGEVAGERQRLRELDDEIARVAAIVDAQSEAHASARALTERVEAFLRGLSGCVIADRPVVLPATKRGEAIVDAIELRRRRVRELEAERRAVEAAPIPSTEAKRLAREQVERLAKRGRPNVAPLLAAGDAFRFASAITLVKMPPTGAGSVAQIDVEAIIAWLFRDQLVAALEREIDAQSDDSSALDDRSRAARLEQIAHDLLAVERDEAALVEAAAQQGIIVAHRPDIDVRALLGVEVSLRAEAA